MGDNFIPRHEAIGVVFTVLDAGQARLPARRIDVAPGVASRLQQAVTSPAQRGYARKRLRGNSNWKNARVFS